MTDTDKPQTPPQTTERAADFTTRYANSIYYESTAWDLKLTFGHVEQITAPAVIKQDFAVTIPWPQAKLALFWLRLHVEMAEAEVGAKIPIRKDLVPADLPEELPEPLQEDKVAMERFRETYGRLRREFIKTL
jgi:hypothetical protein